jgi:hypothetical protein
MPSDIRIYGLNSFFWISHLPLSIGDGAAIRSNSIGRGISYFHCFQLSTSFGRDEMAPAIALLNYISDGHATLNYAADISEASAAAGTGVDSIDYL